MSRFPLSLSLRTLVWLQSGRLGDRAGEISRAARLSPDPDTERPIEELRQRLARDTRTIDVVDYGAGTRSVAGSTGKPAVRRVRDIYGRAAATPAWGRFLYRLVRELAPRTVLELGTNLGVSAAHLAAGLAANEAQDGVAGRLVTIEGDATLADMARRHLSDLGHADRVTVITGHFADVLEDVKDQHGPFDLLFIDGHHEEAATLRYWRSLRPAVSPGGCVAFDDIEPGRPVRRAWRRIVDEERRVGAHFVDLIGLGLLFTPRA